MTVKYAGSPTERFATEIAKRKRKKAGKAEPPEWLLVHGCRLPAFIARLSEDEAIAWLEIHGSEEPT